MYGMVPYTPSHTPCHISDPRTPIILIYTTNLTCVMMDYDVFPVGRRARPRLFTHASTRDVHCCSWKKWLVESLLTSPLRLRVIVIISTLDCEYPQRTSTLFPISGRPYVARLEGRHSNCWFVINKNHHEGSTSPSPTAGQTYFIFCEKGRMTWSIRATKVPKQMRRGFWLDGERLVGEKCKTSPSSSLRIRQRGNLCIDA